MDNVKEKVQFIYSFYNEDDGTTHEVTTVKDRDCILANELCEMFLDFMRSAGYSKDNVWDFFKQH